MFDVEDLSAVDVPDRRGVFGAPVGGHSSPRTVTDIHVGDHVCSIHADDEQQRAAVVPFLRSGLDGGEKVLYIVDARTADAVLDDLRSDGVDVEAHLASGNLELLTRADTYVRDGTFDPLAMIEVLRGATDGAIAAGYTALRVTGEMTWAARGLPGSERLIEYEGLLNDFFPGSRALALCQYDRRRFDPAILLDVLRTHPLVAIGADVLDNPYFLPPHEVRAADRAAVDLDRWLRNIVDRRHEEDALRAAIGRSSAVIDAMPDGFSVLDAHGVHLDVNPALCALTGFDAEELIGTGPPHPYWPPEEADAIGRAFGATLAGEAGEFELTFMRKDGTRFPVLVTPAILRDADGRIVLAFATVRDLTERRAAAERERRAASEWETTFASVNDAIWLLDAEQRVVRSNPAADTVFRRLDGSAVGHHCFEVVHGTHAPVAGCPVLRARRTRRRETTELELGGRWFALIADPIVGADGTVQGTVHIVSDITKRREAAEALRASEEQLRITFEHGPFGAALVDLDHRFIRVNEEYARIVGFAVEELLGRRYEDVTHPDDRDADAADIARLVAGETDRFERDKRYVRKDGSVAWGHLVVRLRHDASGRPVGFLGMVDDISERHAAEEALRRSEAQIRGLFEGITLGIATGRIVMEDGRPVDWVFEAANEAYTRVTGLADVVGRRVSDVVPGVHERDPFLLEFYGRIATTGIPDGYEREIASIGRSFSVSAFSPGPGRFTAILNDVTERKRSEATLRQREAELAEAQRIAHVGSWTWDAASDSLTWSDEMYRIVGLAPAEGPVSSADLERLEGPETFRAREDAAAHALASGQPYEDSYDITRADGTVRHLLVRGEPLRGPDGSISGLRGTVADRTERREAERQLFQAQRMETVGRLAGGIAHDFNNLLEIVVGNAEIARSASGADGRADALTEIEDAAQRGAALTRQLLAFSNQQVQTPEVLDIDAALHDLRAMLARLVGESIALTFEADGGERRVFADRAQLGQVLMNLAVNARDAMPSGGQLRIRTADAELAETDPVRPRDLAPGRYVAVTVADSGTGMDEATRDRIFEPFFTTKGVGKGSGLGLSTAQGIARGAGGDLVLAESAPGQGTTFVLYLPSVDEPAPGRRRAAEAPVRTGSGTILVVEDDPGIRRLMERMLEGAGYAVLAAEDGVDALAQLDAHPGGVDLVVTDMMMPNMGGADLCVRLAAERPGLPVILVSGYAGDDLAANGTLPPGVRFLGKPYGAAELTARVREALAP